MLKYLDRFYILLSLFLLPPIALAADASNYSTVNFPPLPKVKKPFIFLAPAGGRNRLRAVPAAD